MGITKGKEDRSLRALWEKHRQERVGYASSEHPFRLLGSGKQNAYKLFCEVFWNLLKPDGRLGVILGGDFIALPLEPLNCYLVRASGA
jgi:hypothetical protein